MKKIAEMVVKNRFTITAVVIGLCIILLGAIVAYKVLSKTEQDDVYFDVESSLPDPNAMLKYEKIGNNAVSVMDADRVYGIIFDVRSNSRAPASYRYIVKSRVVSQQETFTLKPGETRRFEIKVTPTEENKWMFDRSTATENIQYFDLPKDTIIGERLDFKDNIVVGEVTKMYTFVPVAVSVASYGKILNLNITIRELRERPYVKEETNIVNNSYDRVIVKDRLEIIVEGDHMKVVEKTENGYYTSVPDMFKVVVYKEGLQTQQKAIKMFLFEDNSTSQSQSKLVDGVGSISFLYRIR